MFDLEVLFLIIILDGDEIMKKISFILVVVWLLIIFMLSGEKAPESNHTSDSITVAIVKLTDKTIGLNINDKEIDKIVIKVRPIIRKLAHITEYLILAILIFNLVVKFNFKTPYVISFILCLSLSVLDEFHQLFVSGRTGQLKDVVIDMLGSITAILIIMFLNKRNNLEKMVKNQIR